MSYLELLHLKREPFSNSPDPDAFYGAQTHSLCLNRLEIAVRLRRGLNVVLGKVGTGKTTLCRHLLRTLSGKDDLEVFFLLDPGSADEKGFMRTLMELFGCAQTPSGDVQTDIGQIQEVVFEKGLRQGKNLVLLIDEGQKLTAGQLEVLRVLLNFETNTEKLLQIVIFAQPEFRELVASIPNVQDRVNECLTLEALSEEESLVLMRHRLKLAGEDSGLKLFSDGALRAIYRAGQGRPRQMIRLGHLTLAMIMANRQTVDEALVRAQVLRDGGQESVVRHKAQNGTVKILAGVLLSVCVGAACVAGYHFYEKRTGAQKSVSLPLTTAPSGTRPVEAPAEPPVAPAAGVGQKEVAVPRFEAETEAAAVDRTGGDRTGSDGATSAAPNERAMLGTVLLERHLPMAQVAQIFYASGAQTVVAALEECNPDYETDGSLQVRLPVLTFPVPEVLRKNAQLSVMKFTSAQDAYAAMRRLESLDPRFVVRRNKDGTMVFHLMARASFSVPDRAWIWLSAHQPPKGIVPEILEPYAADEKSFCAYE